MQLKFPGLRTVLQSTRHAFQDPEQKSDSMWSPDPMGQHGCGLDLPARAGLAARGPGRPLEREAGGDGEVTDQRVPRKGSRP